MSYTVHQAKTNLSKLIKEAESGKEVIITRGKQPVAKIVPISGATIDRVPGSRQGQHWQAPGALEPLTDDELRELGLE